MIMQLQQLITIEIYLDLSAIKGWDIWGYFDKLIIVIGNHTVHYGNIMTYNVMIKYGYIDDTRKFYQFYKITFNTT